MQIAVQTDVTLSRNVLLASRPQHARTSGSRERGAARRVRPRRGRESALAWMSIILDNLKPCFN